MRLVFVELETDQPLISIIDALEQTGAANVTVKFAPQGKLAMKLLPAPPKKVKGRIDVEAGLREHGLTVKELFAVRVKRGSPLDSLKCAIIGRRRKNGKG